MTTRHRAGSATDSDFLVELSIVTICFNNAMGLSRTLQSIDTQIGAEKFRYEIVVVDGGSRDDTSDVVAKYSHLPISFESEPDNNVYDAMNKGLKRCRGAYVQFLNSGDYLYNSESLATILNCLESYPLWLIAGAVRPGKGGDLVKIDNVPHQWFRHAFGKQSHCHQSTVFSVTALRSINGHSEEYSFIGDFDLFLRFGIMSKPTTYLGPVVVYEGGGMSEARAGEIPFLQRKVRSDRLMYPVWVERLDLLFTRYVSLRSSLARRYRLTVSKVR